MSEEEGTTSIRFHNQDPNLIKEQETETNRVVCNPYKQDWFYVYILYLHIYIYIC